MELKQIAHIIRKLLSKIEDAVPLINLAITASGASLSSSLPPTVSPSRLLQASTFLTAGDSQYANSAAGRIQIGPTFVLSLYMLFSGHIRAQDEDDVRRSTWKEAIHKAVVRLMRVPLGSLHEFPGVAMSTPYQKTSTPQDPNNDYFASSAMRSNEFAYQLVIVEDLDDDRVHSFEDDEPQPESCGDIDTAGIRELVPVHEISKIFYADTGKILNIGSEGEANNPVLLLKRDPRAVPPRRMMNAYDEFEDVAELGNTTSPLTFDNGKDANHPSSTQNLQHHSNITPSDHPQQQIAHTKSPWRLPSSLDPEWIAFEVYKEADDSDTETENESTVSVKQPQMDATTPSPPTAALSRLHVNSSTPTSASEQPSSKAQTPSIPSIPAVRTSLSLLEMLIRLLSLQQFQQTPHLSIPDELLTFFLSESASTGVASNNVQQRKQLREDARRRVGFDPYDESPVKRRGEEYQYNSAEARDSRLWNGVAAQEFTDEQYGSPIGSARFDDVPYEDEGYNTYNLSMPSHSGTLPFTPRRAATDSPADLSSRNRPSKEPVAAYSGGTSRLRGSGRPTSTTSRSEEGRYGLRSLSVSAPKGKGSPLARSDRGLVDKTPETSPNLQGEAEK